ncbi:MAG: tyrosine-type recombinase/integrase [Anaerolineae bacterium]|nr:tyrosine-type recombinase/integrase [Anaerolineae bacterium]
MGRDVIAVWRESARTWENAAAGWLAAVGSAHTRHAYEAALAQFLAHWLERAATTADVGTAQLWRVSGADVRAWQRALHARGLSPATINARLAALSSFFRYCTTEMIYTDQVRELHKPLLLVNPCATVKRLAVPRKPRVALSVEQARALLRACDRTTLFGLRDYALLLGYLLTAQRNSELRALRWGDIREEDGEGDNNLVYYWEGKGKSGVESLHPEIYAAITAYLRAAGRLETILPEDYIFIAMNDAAERLPHVAPGYVPTALSRQRVNQIVKRQARRAGLRAEMVTVHTLRRTAARRFYEASDFDLDETAKALHHSSTTTTRVYLNQPERGAREIWNTVAARYGL